ASTSITQVASLVEAGPVPTLGHGAILAIDRGMTLVTTRRRPRQFPLRPYTLSALATFLCDSPRSRLSLRISFNLFIFSRFAAKESSSPGDTPRLPVTTPRKCSPCSGIGAHVAPESVLTMVRRPQTVSMYCFNREQHDKFVQGEDLDPGCPEG